MLSGRLERNSVREAELAQVLQSITLLVMGPTVIIASQDAFGSLSDDLSAGFEQAALTGMALYLEALVEGLLEAYDHIKIFWALLRPDSKRNYSRKLLAIPLPSWLFSFRSSETGADVMTRSTAVRSWLVSIVVVLVVCLPTVVMEALGFQDGDATVFSFISLFFIITIASKGNLLAASVFLLERAHGSGIGEIEPYRFKHGLIGVYLSWLTLTILNTFRRYQMYTKDEPKLRALAKLFLFRVGPETVATAATDQCGLLSIPPMYISLENKNGVGRIDVSGERPQTETDLQNMERICDIPSDANVDQT